jgi:hypothetical protein
MTWASFCCFLIAGDQHSVWYSLLRQDARVSQPVKALVTQNDSTAGMQH